MKSRIKYFLKWLHRSANPINWGLFRSVTPVSSKFGLDRGTPIDRYYIQNFLETNKNDIKGIVMEVGDNYYTTKYGGCSVKKSDVLHAVQGNKNATIVGDLAQGIGIPENEFDCIILTQVYPFIFDVENAIKNTVRALKPGGVLLATVAGISQISKYDDSRWGDYWRFTETSLKVIFGKYFNEKQLEVDSFGNVLVSCAFLQGISCEELTDQELSYKDKNYQLLLTIKAKK